MAYMLVCLQSQHEVSAGCIAMQWEMPVLELHVLVWHASSKLHYVRGGAPGPCVIFPPGVRPGGIVTVKVLSAPVDVVLPGLLLQIMRQAAHFTGMAAKAREI